MEHKEMEALLQSCQRELERLQAVNEIQKIMACGVDDEGLENIFYHNAAKFMGLK